MLYCEAHQGIHELPQRLEELQLSLCLGGGCPSVFYKALKSVDRDLEEMTGLSSQHRLSMLIQWYLQSSSLGDQMDSSRHRLCIMEPPL